MLTISLHETGQMLFPGHRVPGRRRRARTRSGSAVNVALPPGTSDAGWLRAFHAVVPPLLREFAPDVLVTQQGCDSHRDDPLAHLALSVDGQRASYLALHDLAHEVAGGRWVAFGGGGYAVVDVVPRAWTHLLAVVSGHPLDPAIETPASWRDEVAGAARRARAVADDRRPQRRPTATGPRATTRTPGWTARSRPPGTSAFPCNGLDPHM